MAYGELFIPEDRRKGRFTKGCRPKNKGKKWDEFMSKEGQERAKKGWKNLETYRHKGPTEGAGKPKRKVVVMNDDGKYRIFESIADTCRAIGCIAPNVRRCIRMNEMGTITRKGRLNSNHKYKGYRFYYAENEIWKRKIDKPLKK